jgi:ferredoxin--NADP+ reductase
MRPYHVAIVGSGPSGYFAAASLLKFADSEDAADVRVDMLEMLPTPWGLVRSGVAPDHPKIKSISAQFEKTALDPRFRFFGNIVVGDHVQAAELAERYDAVIYAVGAQSDRSLGIPGEDLPGSVAAVDFVGWYNAHPHFEEMAPDVSSGRAVVVGNGNVALDVARILVTDPDVLATTDIADHALKALHDRGVEEVLIVGPRGPLQAPFTTLELRELGDLEGPRRRRRDRRPGRLRRHLRRGRRGREQDRPKQHQGAARLRRTRAAGRQAAHRVPVPHLADRDQGRGSRRIDRVGPQRAGRRQRPHRRQGHRRARGGACPTRGAGGRIPRRPDAGLPFDDRSGTIPHTGGKIDGSRNEYVVGWIKRGPTGVIGSNKKDSQETVDTLVSDLSGADLADVGEDYSEDLVEWLLERQPKLVTDDHWKLINEYERSARSAARQAAGQADQRGRIVAHRPRLSSLQRRTWVTGTLSVRKACLNPTLGELRRVRRGEGPSVRVVGRIHHREQLPHFSANARRRWRVVDR